MVIRLTLFALAPSGCAEIVGVEDFSVETNSSFSTGTGVDDTCSKVNGCDRALAENYTTVASDTVYVAFDDMGYSPACIRIRNAMKVVFNSSTLNFQDVPITGGVAPDAPDPSSPIQNPLDTKLQEATFTLAGSCVFPYYSPPLDTKYRGAVFVGGLD